MEDAMSAQVASGEDLLIERSQGGDPTAFDELVASHEDKIYNLVYRITGNAQDALDAAQEAFIKAFRALPRYRRQASFDTWLYRIATNAALDIVRRRPNTPVVPLDKVTLSDHRDNPDAEAERREVQRRIHVALGALAPDHRLIIVLRDLQGLSYEEIAKILRVPLGTVRSRLSRARQALRPFLADLVGSTDFSEEGQ